MTVTVTQMKLKNKENGKFGLKKKDNSLSHTQTDRDR